MVARLKKTTTKKKSTLHLEIIHSNWPVSTFYVTPQNSTHSTITTWKYNDSTNVTHLPLSGFNHSSLQHLWKFINWLVGWETLVSSQKWPSDSTLTELFWSRDQLPPQSDLFPSFIFTAWLQQPRGAFSVTKVFCPVMSATWLLPNMLSGIYANEFDLCWFQNRKCAVNLYNFSSVNIGTVAWISSPLILNTTTTD